MPGPSRLLALFLVPLALAACEHTGPGGVTAQGDVGPYSPGYPRRLTFSLDDDRTPSVAGGTLVYTRQGDAYANRDYAPTGREECLAFLPVEGGSVERLLCPHTFVAPSDTFVNSWFEPALSPDGRRIAFTWQRGPNVGPLGFASVYLMVTAVDRPADTTAVRLPVNYADSGLYPRRADFASKISWLDDTHLRFLATYEHIFKVKGDGAARVTDTIYTPLALMDADLGAGALTPVPGGDSVIAYAAAPSGGVWVVREPDPTALLLLDPGTGARTLVGRFSAAAIDLAAVDGQPVAVIAPVGDPAPGGLPVAVFRGGTILERLDPATGARSQLIGFIGPIHHIAAAGVHRFVLEIEPSLQPYGVAPDLWLFEFPPP